MSRLLRFWGRQRNVRMGWGVLAGPGVPVSDRGPWVGEGELAFLQSSEKTAD